MYTPLNLNVTFDLEKFNSCHLLVMTNHNTKLEDPWAMNSLVIDQTRFVYGPAFAKLYTPSSSKGGIIMLSYLDLYKISNNEGIEQGHCLYI